MKNVDTILLKTFIFEYEFSKNMRFGYNSRLNEYYKLEWTESGIPIKSKLEVPKHLENNEMQQKIAEFVNYCQKKMTRLKKYDMIKTVTGGE